MAKTQKTELAVIDFTKFSVAQLPELQGKKEEIKGIIEANPIVEIIDNSTYELAKKSRTAVKTLRTSLEKEQKEVNSRIKKNVLEVIANEYDSLIGQVKEKESEHQEPITIWEDIKEQERQEKARIKQERVDGIKAKIKSFADLFNTKIENLTFAGIEEFKTEFDEFVKVQPKDVFQEFEVLYDDMLSRITYSFSQKKAVLIAEENNRLEKIRLAEERANIERKDNIQRAINEWFYNWSERIDTLSFFFKDKTFADFKNEKALDCQEFQSEYAEKRNLLVQKFESKIALLQQIEDNRIASEKLAKEKADFEEKQLEAKYQERKKFLVDEDYWRIYFQAECFERESTAKLNLLLFTDEGFEDFKKAVLKAKEPVVSEHPIQDASEQKTELFNIASVDKQIQENSWTEQGRLIEKDGVLFDTHLNKVYEPDNVQIIKDVVGVSGSPLVNYHEEDVDVKGIIVNDEEVVSENIKFESLDEETGDKAKMPLMLVDVIIKTSEMMKDCLIKESSPSHIIKQLIIKLRKLDHLCDNELGFLDGFISNNFNQKTNKQ